MTAETSPTAQPNRSRKTLWVFTPSRTDPKDLEFILVQRHQLLQDAVERVRESALTGNKHHLLFVGPRGCGKTHLVTLIVSRLSAEAALADRLRIAWLNEDETCTALLELLLKIHAALEKRYPGEYRGEMLVPAYDMQADDALEFVSKHLLASLGSRTLIMVVENLDAIFEGLGDRGQKHLRAFIQQHPQFCIVATAQRLVEDLSDRASPFFGFFQTEHLNPLNVTEATQLLQSIARLQENVGVEEFLATDRGRARVRALHHLSGGNHRIYIVLSQFITRDSFDALLEPFLKMVDELTPYYQERIRWLPPLQRKIVEYLCGCESTVPVKEIAKRLFATPPTISSQLQDLRDKGYVKASQRGRESLYEITEPLMRICVEVKDAQSQQPLRLLVDFLRVWYDDHELKRRLGAMKSASASCAYVESAILRNSLEGNLRKQLLLKDLQFSLPQKWEDQQRDGFIRELATEPEGVIQALASLALGKPAEAIHCLDEHVAQATDPSEKAHLLLCRAGIYSVSGDREQETQDYTKLIELPGAPIDLIAKALGNRGDAFARAGKSPIAIADYTAVIGLTGVPVWEVAHALMNRGITYDQMGEISLEIADYTAVLGLTGASVKQIARALVNRGVTYGQTGETQLAIADHTAVIGLTGAPVEQVAFALVNRGVTYGQTGETQLAIADYAAVIELRGAPVEQIASALVNRGVTYSQTGETQLEIADYTAVIGLTDAPVEQIARALVNRGITYGQTEETQLAIADYAAVIELRGAPVEQIASALVNRGVTYSQTGETQLEIADYTAVIGLTDAPVEQIARALVNRGITYGQTEETQLGIADYTAVIALTGAPVELVGVAFLLRSKAYAQTGEEELAIADLSALIGLSGAPVKLVASALYGRALLCYRKGQVRESRSDLETLIHMSGAPVKEMVNSYFLLSLFHIAEGKWSECFQALDIGLACGERAQPRYYGDMAGLIGAIFVAGLGREGRVSKAASLLEICSRHGYLPGLGEALVESIGKVFRDGPPFPSADNLEEWASAWEQAAENVADFRLSLRLLRTGADFIKTGGKDTGVLLNLTSTEREILRQALGLAESEQANSP